MNIMHNKKPDGCETGLLETTKAFEKELVAQNTLVKKNLTQ